MDLHHIEIFYYLVKLRSFSKAAKMLRLSQPTVSGHIKNLETELGVQLIDRIGKRVVPTEAGDVLYRAGQKFLALRDQTRQEIEGVLGNVTGSLRIGASSIPGGYVLPSVIKMFKQEHPSAFIRLEIGNSARVTESVLAGDLHIGVVGLRSTDPRLEIHPFMQDELVVAVPADHAWVKRKTVTVEELADEPLIVREKGPGSRHVMEERLEEAGMSFAELNPVVIAGNSDAVRQAVKAGLGIAVLSLRAIQNDIATNHLAAVRIKELPLVSNFFIVLLKGKSRLPLCRAFLEKLFEHKVP